MKITVPATILCTAWLVTACQTERTVLAGPTVTGLEASGERDYSARFSNQDPSGYQQNSTGGLNAMSEKMFGGKLDSQTQKEFKANKNFLTREYGGKKDFAAKAWQGAPKDKTWTDKLFNTGESSETDTAFRGAGRAATVKDSPDASKMADTKDFNGSDRTARTGNYRAAERALEEGRDAPKLTSARPDRMGPGEAAIHSRIANSQATASEINKFLGKP